MPYTYVSKAFIAYMIWYDMIVNDSSTPYLDKYQIYKGTDLKLNRMEFNRTN